MTSITPNSHPSFHDEIDLLAMVRSLWGQKLLVGALTLCCTVVAMVYAFSVTPEFQVSTLLRPAALNDLDELNRTGIYSLPPGEALKRVGASLESYETRLGYFRSNAALQAAFMKGDRTIEQAFEEFNSRALKLVQPDPKRSDVLKAFIGLDMRYPAGLDGKSTLNGLVQYAIETERQQIGKDLEVIVQNRIREVDAKLEVARVDYSSAKEVQIAELLEADTLSRAKLNDEMKALRLQLKLRRESRIAELGEAISIARSLGVKRPTTPSRMGQSDGDAPGGVMRAEVNSQQIPLYFLGVDALEAEQHALRRRVSDDFADPRVAEIRKELALLENNRTIQVLMSRKNDELFLRGIDLLRAERVRLSKIRTDMSKVQLVSIDRLAVDPLHPVVPNKPLIIIFGVGLGLVLGVVLALFRHMALTRPRVASVHLSLPSKFVDTLKSPIVSS